LLRKDQRNAFCRRYLRRKQCYRRQPHQTHTLPSHAIAPEESLTKGGRLPIPHCVARPNLRKAFLTTNFLFGVAVTFSAVFGSGTHLALGSVSDLGIDDQSPGWNR
jgi:hypothetical protein